jgi:hypothetical protein
VATQSSNIAVWSIRLSGNLMFLNPILLSTMFQKQVGDWSVYVIVLSGMHCTGNVCVTQRKDPEEELLRALLGASKLLIRQPPSASISFHDRMDIGVRQAMSGWGSAMAVAELR